MDKDPEAAAICMSAFPLFGSTSVARCRSSWTIVCNGEVIKAIYNMAYTYINENSMIALDCPCKNCFVIFGIK